MGFMCSEVIVYFYFSTEEITLINCETLAMQISPTSSGKTE